MRKLQNGSVQYCYVKAAADLRAILRMSALGQKQTLLRILVMSALPPKADIEAWPLDAIIGECLQKQGLTSTSILATRRETILYARVAIPPSK